MSKRRIASCLALGLAGIGIAHGQTTSNDIAKNAKPNILLIIADDMGLDASPCHSVGDNRVVMPNLLSICNDGLVFNNAYSAPVCSPTRATLLTGKYGFRTGVGAAIPRTAEGIGLSSDETTIFDVLEPTDYSTALIGKWHLAGSDDSLDHPGTLGVSDYFGIFEGGIRNYSNWIAVNNGREESVDGYSTTVFTDRAIEWIGTQQPPWFLWLAYNAPHTPFHLPPESLHSNTELSDERNAIRNNPLQYYHAALEALDSEIGRLLKSMSEEVRKNTVIIFLGDNGTPGQVASELYDEHGAKGSIFQGGTNVPLIVQGPGVVKGRTDALVNTTDFFTTIAALAGVSAKTVDSESFVQVLHGNEGSREHAYVEFFSEHPVRGRGELGWAIRDEQYRLVSVDGKPDMLFDLHADPFEQDDLLAVQPSTEIESAAKALLSVYTAIKQ